MSEAIFVNLFAKCHQIKTFFDFLKSLDATISYNSYIWFCFYTTIIFTWRPVVKILLNRFEKYNVLVTIKSYSYIKF